MPRSLAEACTRRCRASHEIATNYCVSSDLGQILSANVSRKQPKPRHICNFSALRRAAGVLASVLGCPGQQGMGHLLKPWTAVKLHHHLILSSLNSARAPSCTRHASCCTRRRNLQAIQQPAGPLGKNSIISYAVPYSPQRVTSCSICSSVLPNSARSIWHSCLRKARRLPLPGPGSTAQCHAVPMASSRSMR